jgi:hypothetical protein
MGDPGVELELMQIKDPCGGTQKPLPLTRNPNLSGLYLVLDNSIFGDLDFRYNFSRPKLELDTPPAASKIFRHEV